MNILIVATTHLFPNEGWPHAGIFFANLIKHVLPLAGRITAICPRAYLPGPVLRLKRFNRQRLVQPHGWFEGIEIYRPHFLSARLSRHGWIHARCMAAAAAPLARSLHASDPFDLIIGHGFGPSAHVAQLLASEFDRRCIGWACGSDVNTGPDISAENMRLFHHTVRRCDLILTNSNALAQTLMRRCPDARHAHPLYPGIELSGLTEPADRLCLRRQLGLADDRVFMISAGAVTVEKGVVEFYTTFRQLRAQFGNLSAILVGDGPQAGRLRAMADSDGLTDHFRITGLLPRAEVLRYMQAADVMVFPSYAEGLPNVVMEAMAAGLPTVATSVGGTGEIIVDGQTGLLVEPRSVPVLVNAVERILASPGWSADLARRGRQFVIRHFDARRNATVAFQVFECLLAGGNPTVPLPACADVSPGQLPAKTLPPPF